jgi:hypothetical protein
VIGPYTTDTAQVPGYQVIVRFPVDVSQPPLFLPETGGSP